MASVSEAVSSKKWDGDGVPLADSNCANIGSDEDKAVRKAAAEKEPAWETAGKKAGVEVWRIEQFEVKAYPEKSYGEFYTGDSYIILKTTEEDGGKLCHDIFFWLGAETTTDEMGTAAYKTVELDDFFDGEPTQHREVQGSESTEFKKLFATLQYLQGGVASGFNHVAEGLYEPKLLRVRKTNTDGVRVQEVTRDRQSLNQGDCFILDVGEKIYVWCGEESSAFEKSAANRAAENIENTRDGKATTTLEIDDDFWAKLGGEGEIAPASAASDKLPDVDHGEGVLYKLSDTTGTLTRTEVAHGDIGPGMLDTNDVMLLDTTAEIFLWVGKNASAGEGRNAMATAMAYLKTNGRPTSTPIHLYKEGQDIKNETWKQIMASGPAAPAAPVRPPPPAPASAEPAGDGGALRLHTTSPAATAETNAAAGVMTLEELQDPKIWKAKGVDPLTREQHLSDEEFQNLFKMSKDEFAGLPDWKKKGEKKKHGLF